MAKKKETEEAVAEAKVAAVRPDRRRLRRWFLGVSGTVLILAASLAVYAFAYQNRILPRTAIAGVAVGGKTQAQAKTALAAAETSFQSRQLTLTYEGKEWQVHPSDLGVGFDTDAALAAAYSLGRENSVWHQLASLFRAPFNSRSVALAAKPLTPAGIDYLKTHVQKDIEKPFVETTLSLVPGHVTTVPGTPGIVLNTSSLTADLAQAFSGGTTIGLVVTSTAPSVTADAAETARAQADAILASAWSLQVPGKSLPLDPKDIATWLTVTPGSAGLSIAVDQTKLTASIAALAKGVDVAASNASLAVKDGTVVTVGGLPGLKVDQAQTAKDLTAALLAAPASRSVTATVAVAQPDIRAETLSSLGINQLIGTGTTDFSGSPSNRVTNIKVGEAKISGKIVKDGQEFSTVGSLAPIDAAHGYVSALVIIGNQTLPADGGGLCQVSTTLFRAALNAGLPITARANHLYEVSYYQRGIGPGLDATIYDPQPDFKWKNDTGHDIYIQGTIKGNTITFDLFGTSDGRTAAVDGPHTLQTYEPSGDPIRVNTDTLAKGVTQLIDPPIQGARTTATYTVTRGGQVINQQTFNSYYQAMPAQYLVGTR